MMTSSIGSSRPVGSEWRRANPYWDTWAVTFLDPDGYRLVLSNRSWP